MASGRVHSRVSVFAGIIVSVALVYYEAKHTMWLLVGFLFQVFMSPDRDLNQPSIGEYYLRKHAFLLYHYWRSLWIPYGIVMRHRGKSHAIYGTIVRVIYIVFPLALAMFPILSDAKSEEVTLWQYLVSQTLSTPFAVGMYLVIANFGIGVFCVFVSGIILADFLHILFDGMNINL